MKRIRKISRWTEKYILLIATAFPTNNFLFLCHFLRSFTDVNSHVTMGGHFQKPRLREQTTMTRVESSSSIFILYYVSPILVFFFLKNKTKNAICTNRRQQHLELLFPRIGTSQPNLNPTSFDKFSIDFFISVEEKIVPRTTLFLTGLEFFYKNLILKI